jgi:hypothetical protein
MSGIAYFSEAENLSVWKCSRAVMEISVINKEQKAQ